MGMSFEVSDPEETCEADVRICPTCGKEVVRDDMLFTHDCHGITFRLVCFDCYEKLMAKGYDGQYYNEADECLDEEYYEVKTMAEMNFSEEQMREFCKEAVPVVEKLLEIARKHGVEGGVRTWCADDYVSIEGTGLGGWELHKCSGEYDMTYNKRVPLFEKENGEKTQ